MQSYIKGLNGIRAFAIIFVLFTHLDTFQNISNPFIKQAMQLLFGPGVEIFYVLSGFLITKILLTEKYVKNNISLTNFYVRRILRIIPCLYIFIFTLIILNYFSIITIKTPSIVFALLFLTNFVNDVYANPILSHTWSLAVEEHFYLIFPFLVKYLNFNKLFIYLILILVGGIIFQFLIYKHSLFSHTFNPSKWTFANIHIIIIGCLFAMLEFSFIKKYENSIFKEKFFFLFLTIIMYCSLLLINNSLLFNILSKSICWIAVGYVLSWFFYNQNSVIVKIFEVSPLVYIGKISYSLYVWQGLFLRTGPGGELWIQKFPQNIILSFICAIISYEVIEKKNPHI